MAKESKKIYRVRKSVNLRSPSLDSWPQNYVGKLIPVIGNRAEMNWIHVAQDRDQWRAHVNTGLKLEVLQNVTIRVNKT
jgi:hypothetical protein